MPAGRNRGRSSKFAVKSPCSPQPADGVDVADEAENGLVAFAVGVALLLDGREVWMVKRPDELDSAEFVVDLVAGEELLEREVRPLCDVDVPLTDAKLNGVEITEVGDRTAGVSEGRLDFERADVSRVDGDELPEVSGGGDLVGIDGDGIETSGV